MFGFQIDSPFVVSDLSRSAACPEPASAEGAAEREVEPSFSPDAITRGRGKYAPETADVKEADRPICPNATTGKRLRSSLLTQSAEAEGAAPTCRHNARSITIMVATSDINSKGCQSGFCPPGIVLSAGIPTYDVARESRHPLSPDDRYAISVSEESP
jgi:hypothetical protein